MTVPTQPGLSLTAPQPWAALLAPVPIRATVSLPGSKSETNRALLLAALANAPSTIRNGLEARDTRLMRQALRAFGVLIDEDDDGWHIQPPGQFIAPAEIDCGLAGTVMRFVPALAALAT
ncbi:MAG: 3-phosphoshikimate 1-carboxyvinyltransferase, partial [Propionibacteriaceae bacterium]